MRHATFLAKATNATLHIVHVYHSVGVNAAAMSASSGGPVVDIDRLNENMAEHANAICASAVEDAEREGVAVEPHLVYGDPCDALIDVARKVNADLLVVGNRGMTGVKRFVLGSVPNRISHHAPCSLLIVDTTH